MGRVIPLQGAATTQWEVLCHTPRALKAAKDLNQKSVGRGVAKRVRGTFLSTTFYSCPGAISALMQSPPQVLTSL